MRATLALWLIVVSSTTAFGAMDLEAQRLDRRSARVAEQPPGAPGLEQQFRERLAQVVRNRLSLDDAQMERLRQVNTRMERQRAQLLRQERQVRMALRSEVLAGDSAADQAKVAQLLDDALRIQHRRLDLVEEEQRALAAFMTPVQRAKYFAIQDELRRRLEDIRQQRRQRSPGGPPAGAARSPLPE